MCVDKHFNISRESLGFEPFIKKVDPTNSNHKIKNNSFKIKESQKYLELREDQIRNAVKIGILTAVTISDVLYICIRSVLKVQKDLLLIEKILDEDEITTNVAAEMIDISTKNIRRLIDEGYLTIVGTMEFKYGLASLVKRGEVKKLIPHIEEIKDFWKKQAKINRQLGAKKAVEIRKTGINHSLTFKDHFLKKIENLPHKQAKLIRACISIVALDYYIERKLHKRIVDQEMIDLKSKSIKKLIEVYKDSEHLNIKYVQGHEPYFYYCDSCLENIKELRYDLSISWVEARSFFEPCRKCKVDQDYFSMVMINIEIFEYNFSLYVKYRDVSNWFDRDNYHCEIPARLPYQSEDHLFIDKQVVALNDIKTFKIFEVVDYLKEFINSKDLDLSLNL